MPHVVAKPCDACRYTDCVVVCPVECFYEGEKMLYINPDGASTAKPVFRSVLSKPSSMKMISRTSGKNMSKSTLISRRTLKISPRRKNLFATDLGYALAI